MVTFKTINVKFNTTFSANIFRHFTTIRTTALSWVTKWVMLNTIKTTSEGTPWSLDLPLNNVISAGENI